MIDSIYYGRNIPICQRSGISSKRLKEINEPDHPVPLHQPFLPPKVYIGKSYGIIKIFAEHLH